MNTATERSERSRAQRVFNGRAVTRHITCCEDDRLSAEILACSGDNGDVQRLVLLLCGCREDTAEEDEEKRKE